MLRLKCNLSLCILAEGLLFDQLDDESNQIDETRSKKRRDFQTLEKADSTYKRDIENDRVLRFEISTRSKFWHPSSRSESHQKRLLLLHGVSLAYHSWDKRPRAYCFARRDEKRSGKVTRRCGGGCPDVASSSRLISPPL